MKGDSHESYLNIVVIEDHTDAQHQLQEKLQEYEKANPAHHFQTYLKVCTHFNGNCYIYSKRSSSIPIPYKDILYFSSYLHCVRIITMEAVYEQYISFSSIRELLPESFCQCHRSVIVNMNHVECLNASVLTLSNNEQLTVSKPYLKQIQEAILLL